MAKNITPRKQDYSQWYLDVIKTAELADYAPVRGCMVIRPTGYGIWEQIQSKFDRAFKATGHVNAYFPLLIPTSFLAKEAEHVEGFSPECAVVTHAGGEELEEPMVIRPTSETVIGHMYSKWIQSWRDLPVLINQWCNVMRWEKRPRLFLRTSEFLWQEGHTAHATKEEAMEEAERMLEVYRKIMTDDLALPVISGTKSEGERFPGAEETYTTETMMSDTKALQAGTSHFLGQNFSKAFDIKFQNKDEEMEYAWTTSWGISTRLIGAIIMTHSDDDGLVIPPRVAPVKAVIVPISKDEQTACDVLLPKALDLAKNIEALTGPNTVVVDRQFHMRPSDRFFYHLQRGVPLRLELGENELEKGVLRAVRRDTGEKFDMSWDGIGNSVDGFLETMQKDMFDKARSFRLKNTHEAHNMDEMAEILNTEGGFVRAFFAGTAEDEKVIKEKTGVTVRCFPFEDMDKRGQCFYTGKENSPLAIFAKSY